MTGPFPCRDCEGTGDHWRHDPQADDPELRTRRYGVPCLTCEGSGVIACEDCGERPATECWDYSEAPIPVIPPPDYFCERCADKRRDTYAEHMAENF